MAKKKQAGTAPKKKRSDAKAAGRAGGSDGGTRKPDKAKKKRPAGTPEVQATASRRAVQAAIEAAAPTTPSRAPTTVPDRAPTTVPDRAPTTVPDRAPRSLGDVDGFLAALESITDPERRYEVATEALGEHVKVIERLSAVRGDAVAAAYGAGGSVRSLAQRLGVSPSRVHQLMQEAQARGSRPGPPQ